MLKRKAVSVLTVIAVVASLNRYAKAEDDNPNYSAENDAQHRQSFSQMISKTDHFVGIATSDKDRQNICIHLKIENSTVNQETQTLELIVNISRIYQDSSSNEEELRIEVTEGKNLHMNITRGSHVIEVRGELVPSENQTCFIVVPKYNGDQCAAGTPPSSLDGP
ncbi:uncharacterized protein LOC142559273 [Dermacentor variabilis]|uniref:uncharacterized protein LOC142559273 n=1 Tax=Dermacentor variabilis TaxID=34621 RepID=UPI003F5BC61E